MMTTLTTHRLRLLVVAVTFATLAVASTGCEILLSFNRALIDSGIEGGLDGPSGLVDAGFDAGDASDAAVDALIVPDAVADVDHVEASSTPDAGATIDAGDAGHGDAGHLDATSHDATATDASGDAHADGTTPHDGAIVDGAMDSASKG